METLAVISTNPSAATGDSIYFTAKSEINCTADEQVKTTASNPTYLLSKSLVTLHDRPTTGRGKLNKSVNDMSTATGRFECHSPASERGQVKPANLAGQERPHSVTTATAISETVLTSTPHVTANVICESDVIEATETTSILPGQKLSSTQRCLLSVGGLSNILSIPKIFITPASPVASVLPAMGSPLNSRFSPIEYALDLLSTDEQNRIDYTTRTLSECVDIRGALTLSYHQVTLEVDLRSKPLKFLDQCRMSQATSGQKRKKILHGVSGIFAPGLNAIMGPSGSGKSSLLEILSGRHVNEGVCGRVLVNGQLITKKFSQQSGYGSQEDILNPGLTIREQLWYSLCLSRQESLDTAGKLQLLNELLNSLDLQSCADVKVGSAHSHKVSGGERKRTAIGMELVSAPKILFLDEPTSKLDSNTSKSLVRILKKLSRKGRTIIMTIHQPSYDIYRHFNTLTLIAQGRTIYHGSAKNALDYFTEIGYKCDVHNSPPDFFLDVLHGLIDSSSRSPAPRDSSGRSSWKPVSLQRSVFYRSLNNNSRQRGSDAVELYLHNDVFSSMSSADDTNHLQVINGARGYASQLDITTREGVKYHGDVVVRLHERYVTSSLCRRNKEQLDEIENVMEKSVTINRSYSSKMIVENNPPHHLSFLREYGILATRMMASSPRIFLALSLMNIIIGLLYGTLYYHPNRDEPPSIQNRLGMFFQLAIHGVMVPSMIAANSFAVTEKLLFIHEMKGGRYRAGSYCLSRCTNIVVARTMSAILFSVTVYWLTGLKGNAEAFFAFSLTSFCAGIACDAICLVAALVFDSFSAAKILVVLYMTLTSVFAGFLLDVDSTFSWIAWIKYISVTRYCYVGWVLNEFSGQFVTRCPRMFTAERKRHAVVIKARLVAMEMGDLTGRGAANVTECTFIPGDSVVPQVVGSDEFLFHQPWLCNALLLGMAFILFVLCFWRMHRFK